MKQPCQLCGTRTGLHGFSFNKQGSYQTEKPKTGRLIVLKTVLNEETGQWEHIDITPQSD